MLNKYEAADVTMDKQARYEKLYRQYKDLLRRRRSAPCKPRSTSIPSSVRCT
ncbi:hypothetical protein LP419_35555 [Massilia sp. H-1]|nr:hypothetical protein LP419_35555 [Massilia sp. H-1]